MVNKTKVKYVHAENVETERFEDVDGVACVPDPVNSDSGKSLIIQHSSDIPNTVREDVEELVSVKNL